MPEFLCRRVAQTFALACLLLLATGCGGSNPDDYVTASDPAKTALDQTLAAWQNGQPAGKVATASGSVELVDPDWNTGQKLLGYEILSSDASNGPPRFAVKLRLAAPAGEREVRYIVVGKDALHVYREEDYQNAMGMN